MPIPVRIQVQPDPAIQPTPQALKEPTEVFLFDISEFGIGLLSNAPLPWGILVLIELPRAALAPTSQPSPGGSVRITGRVVHAIPQGNQYRLGISFIRLDDTDRALIQKLTAPPERRRSPRIPMVQLQTLERPER